MCRDQHSHGGMFSNSFGVCSVNVASLPWTTPILFSEQTLLAVVYNLCSNVYSLWIQCWEIEARIWDASPQAYRGRSTGLNHNPWTWRSSGINQWASCMSEHGYLEKLWKIKCGRSPEEIHFMLQAVWLVLPLLEFFVPGLLYIFCSLDACL
jgi:hypothetical protein